MKEMRSRVFALLEIFWCQVCCSWAVPAYPKPAKIRQPDGTVVTECLLGDEWQHVETTTDGYAILKDARVFYVYAAKKDGKLVPTAQRVHDEALRSEAEYNFLRGVQKGLMPEMPKEIREMKHQAGEQQQVRRFAKNNVSSYDYENFRGLVILAEFNDRSFSRSDYKSLVGEMLNKEDFSNYDDETFTGSVHDYYSGNSAGRFQPVFDLVGSYVLENFSQYDASGMTNGYKLVREAIRIADEEVDFNQYDGDADGFVNLVYVIFAGYDSHFASNDRRLLWPHHYSVFLPVDEKMFTRDYACSTEFYGIESDPKSVSLSGIGVICHEFMHVLGLPDLYDTDQEESGGLSCDPGEWSLMSTGCYGNQERTPVGLSLFERWFLCFADSLSLISEAGTYTLQPLPESLHGYRIDTPVADEYFLFENRSQEAFKWDAFLPGSGMLVHHVDFTKPDLWSIAYNKLNANPAHNYYKMQRAGGERKDKFTRTFVSSNADPFPGSKDVIKLTNASSPANLLSWSCEPCGWELTDIQLTDERTISFNVLTSESSIKPLSVDTKETIRWYTLDGCLLDGKPTDLGIYIGDGGLRLSIPSVGSR